MVMPVFLLAFCVITTVFVSTLWNAGQVAIATGGKRVAHLSIVVLMIAILALLGLGAPELFVRFLAGGLIAMTMALCISERGRYFPICAVQFAFGLLVVSGVPFHIA